MTDLTLYSDMIYVVIMLIVGILLVWWTVRKIVSTRKNYQNLNKKNKEFREGPAIGVIISMIILWTCYIALGIAAWQLKASLVKTETSENPAQVEEIGKIMEHEPASDEELVKRKNELVEKRDIEPHERKLSEFEKRMEEEAAKIRRRNNLEEPNNN